MSGSSAGGRARCSREATSPRGCRQVSRHRRRRVGAVRAPRPVKPFPESGGEADDDSTAVVPVGGGRRLRQPLDARDHRPAGDRVPREGGGADRDAAEAGSAHQGGRVHPRDARLHPGAPLGWREVGQRLPGQQAPRPSLHQRAADPQRRGHRPADCRDGLHLDHRVSHGRRHGALRALLGATNQRNGRRPGVRRPGAHEPRSAGNAAPRAPRPRLRHRSRGAAPVRRGDGPEARPRDRGRHDAQGGRRRQRSRRHLRSDPQEADAHNREGLAEARLVRECRGLRQLLVARRARRVRPDRYRRPRAVPGTSRRVGYFQHTPDPYADLGEIVAGLKPGREDDREKTMAINLGLALDDMAVAPEVFRRAKARGLGTWLAL